MTRTRIEKALASLFIGGLLLVTFASRAQATPHICPFPNPTCCVAYVDGCLVCTTCHLGAVPAEPQ